MLNSLDLLIIVFIVKNPIAQKIGLYSTPQNLSPSPIYTANRWQVSREKHKTLCSLHRFIRFSCFQIIHITHFLPTSAPRQPTSSQWKYQVINSLIQARHALLLQFHIMFEHILQNICLIRPLSRGQHPFKTRSVVLGQRLSVCCISFQSI